MAELKNPSNGAAAGHEHSDVDSRSIALFGALLAVIIMATLLAAYGLLHFFYTDVLPTVPLPSPLAYNREPTPEPRLWVTPGEERAALKAKENNNLASYDWVDRDKVRIPNARESRSLRNRDFRYGK
jgi:hypothetical protein